MTISVGALTTLLDSIAAGKLMFDNAMGLLGTEPNTVSKATLNDLATIAATNDANVQADLLPDFRFRSQVIVATSLYQTLGAYRIWWALDKHCGGLDPYMNANNVRASVHVKQLGFPLGPAQIMPPAVDPMATYTVGSGYTHVADIDTTQYGRAWLQAVVTSTIGGSPIQATVMGLQIDNATPVSKTVTISAGSSVGTVVNIGTMGVQADSYDSITNVTTTGGTSGDAFKVRSRVERTISAVS